MTRPIEGAKGADEARLLRQRTKPRLVYLAGSYTSKEALKHIRERINALGGFKVTSSWLDEPKSNVDWTSLDRDQADTIAARDVDEVAEAEVFILDTLLPSTGGGYDTELGIALSTGSVTYRVGPRRNGFQGLVMHEVQDWESLFRGLKRWEKNVWAKIAT